MKIYVLLAIGIVAIACNNSLSTSQSTDTTTVVNNDTSKVQSNGYTNNLVDSSKLVANKQIIPGQNIGDAILNMNADSLEILFGKPDFSDAAMGKAWITWYGKKIDEKNNKTQLNIYTSFKDSNMTTRTVQQIRTTSSYFSTDNNVHVYSSLSDIKKAFPGAKMIEQNPNDAMKFVVYDDVWKGIAFQVAHVDTSDICTGIFVHLKGKKVRDVYIDAPQ